MIRVSLEYDLAFGYRRVSASYLKTLLKMSIPDKRNVIFLLIFFKGFFISCNYHVKSYCFSDRSKVNLVPLTLLYGGPLALLIPIMCLFFKFQSYFDAILINIHSFNALNMFLLPTERRSFQRYIMFMKHMPMPDRRPPLSE